LPYAFHKTKPVTAGSLHRPNKTCWLTKAQQRQETKNEDKLKINEITPLGHKT
jgi:hypothetical protein